MKLKIISCADENIFKTDIGSKIIIDGNQQFGISVIKALENDLVAKLSVVAINEENITEEIVGTTIVDECQTHIVILLAYVLKKYRKQGIFKSMLQKVITYAKSIDKPIMLYCKESLCEVYEKCGFKYDDENKLIAMIFDLKGEEKWKR